MLLPWIFCGVLLAATVFLAIKIYSLKKSMAEISAEFHRLLAEDTNNLIFISSSDKHAKKLAASINRELAELRKQKLRYQKADSELKTAITNISHDLRTPLTAIFGYLELLEKQEESESISRYIMQIRGRAEAMAQLTEELFRYSVLYSEEEQKMQDTDIRGILEEALVSFYGAMKNRGITPQIVLPKGTVVRKIPPYTLSRIFDNIISNAIKYSDGDFFVTLTEKGEISFSNTAKKLSSVDVEKLFDRFYTVDSARKTTGLGLSIAKLLTERIGCTISANYREGKLTITLYFS